MRDSSRWLIWLSAKFVWTFFKSQLNVSNVLVFSANLALLATSSIMAKSARWDAQWMNWLKPIVPFVLCSLNWSSFAQTKSLVVPKFSTTTTLWNMLRNASLRRFAAQLQQIVTKFWSGKKCSSTKKCAQKFMLSANFVHANSQERNLKLITLCARRSLYSVVNAFQRWLERHSRSTGNLAVKNLLFVSTVMHT